MTELPKFLPLETVINVLSISRSQAYAFVRHRDLPAIQVGGRGQWRVDVKDFHAYIDRRYAASCTRPPSAEPTNTPR